MAESNITFAEPGPGTLIQRNGFKHGRRGGMAAMHDARSLNAGCPGKLPAKLAAFYSKGKGRQVPVNYTLRKHVKKPGGSPDGYVIFTEEKLLIVSCEENEVKVMAEKHE